MDIPIVRKIVSFPGTVPSYTSQFAAAGVPSVPIIAILYVAEDAAVLQMAMVEIFATVEEGVVYRVAYVDVPAVPWT